MLLILSTAFIPLFVRALRVPYGILMPLIIVFCITGAYSLKNNVWDVGQMLVFGVLGYAMKKLGYSPAALTLALVLGPAGRAGAAPVADHLRRRRGDLLPAADLGGAHDVAALAAVLVPVVRALVAAYRRRGAARVGAV